MRGESDFQRMGGAATLRPIIEDFTQRVFGDVMIGFLFEGKPKSRITEMEYRFAAVHLGAELEYTGRSMDKAHRGSPILGGHFARRREILRRTLVDHGVDSEITARWMAHIDSLRTQILGADARGDGCDHEAQAARVTPAPDLG